MEQEIETQKDKIDQIRAGIDHDQEVRDKILSR